MVWKPYILRGPTTCGEAARSDKDQQCHHGFKKLLYFDPTLWNLCIWSQIFGASKIRKVRSLNNFGICCEENLNIQRSLSGLGNTLTFKNKMLTLTIGEMTYLEYVPPEVLYRKLAAFGRNLIGVDTGKLYIGLYIGDVLKVMDGVYDNIGWFVMNDKFSPLVLQLGIMDGSDMSHILNDLILPRSLLTNANLKFKTRGLVRLLMTITRLKERNLLLICKSFARNLKTLTQLPISRGANALAKDNITKEKNDSMMRYAGTLGYKVGQRQRRLRKRKRARKSSGSRKRKA
ncbi:hypothetical protein QYF36_006845 [Acer negundo]|nr:hypothetical protein QYF36_006845 [Acer negundo]